jgi:hypothetical protein
MLLEAAAVLCLTNATDAAVFGQVRDSRFKTTSAKLSGTSLTYRQPVGQAAFPAVAAGQTGCAPVDVAALAKPHLMIWSHEPAPDAVAVLKADVVCRPTAPPSAGQRLTFVYRKSLLGQPSCKETR